jgi:hypothetical protein
MNEEQETQSLTTSETEETETKTESLVTQEENKTEETKTEETQEEVKVEPLTVEQLSAPEGFEIQPELASEFLEILNGEMAPGDKANAFLALHAKTISAAQEADSKAWDEMQTKWKDEVKADPDIGGAKLQPTITNIGKLISEFGNDDLKEVFNFTGAGNNPHMIKFLNKIADKLTEGNFFKAGTPAGADDPDAAARRMYPSMKG